MIREWFSRLVIGLGTAALLLAAVLAVAPGTFAPLVDTAETAFDGTTGLLVISTAILLGGVIAVWKGKRSIEAEVDPLSRDTAEQQQSGSAGTLRIREFEEMLDTAAAGNEAGRDRVRDDLRDVAVEAIATAENRSCTAVRDDVLAGEWTDDPVAASFLGDVSAPPAPVRWRLYAWLYDRRAFRESVDRTLAAIESYQDEYQ